MGQRVHTLRTARKMILVGSGAKVQGIHTRGTQTMKPMRLSLFLMSTFLVALAPVQDARASAEAEANKAAFGNAFLSRQGAAFYLQGKPVTFMGVNRYELAGGPLATSCTHAYDQASWTAYADDYVAQAAKLGAKFIRLWGFQNFAGKNGTDFSAFDHLVTVAKSNNVQLILTLENNWGDCTMPAGFTKDTGWYSSGYQSGNGYALNFVDYTRAIVTHFKNEPTIAMWQIINEGKLYENPSVLKQFFVTIAGVIRSIDSQHLISSGGAIQCWQGQQGAVDFQSYADSANLDVLDAHDYGSETSAWPDCMDSALQASANLKKPLMIGESGISTDSFSASDRAKYFSSKIQTAAQKGVDAYLIWSLNTHANYNDGFDFFPGDATAAVFTQAASQWFPGPSATPSSGGTGGAGGTGGSSPVMIKSVNSGRVIDIWNGINADGARIQQYDAWSGPMQVWTLDAQADGSVQITNPTTKKALDVAGMSTADGATVQLWTAWGGTNQHWFAKKAADGSYSFVNVNSGKCLDVLGLRTDNGAPLGQWDCNGKSNQQFLLVIP